MRRDAKVNTTVEGTRVASGAPPKHSESRRIVRVFFGRKLAVVGLTLIFILIFSAVFAPWLAPHDPYADGSAE